MRILPQLGGQITLPGRKVPAFIWCRICRTGDTRHAADNRIGTAFLFVVGLLSIHTLRVEALL